MNNEYLLREIKPRNILRHGGPRDHRRVLLYINGKLFETYNEDSSPEYKIGTYFDKWILEEVDHLRQFFPGTVKIQHRLEQDEEPEYV